MRRMRVRGSRKSELQPEVDSEVGACSIHNSAHAALVISANSPVTVRDSELKIFYDSSVRQPLKHSTTTQFHVD